MMPRTSGMCGRRILAAMLVGLCLCGNTASTWAQRGAGGGRGGPAPGLLVPDDSQKPLTLQPDSFLLGTVHVGAVVEASFQVRRAGENVDVLLQILPTPHARAINKSVKFIDKFQNAAIAENMRLVGSVEVSIDTSTPGLSTRHLVVHFDGDSIALPVTVNVVPRKPDAFRLLVLGTPWQEYSTTDGKLFEPWIKLVEQADLDVDYWLVRHEQPVLRETGMREFRAVLLSAEAVYCSTQDDVRRLREYVQGGGRVLICADAFFRGTVDKANDLLQGTGAVVFNEEAQKQFRQPAETSKFPTGSISQELLDAGINRLDFLRGSPIQIRNPQTARVLVTIPNQPPYDPKSGDGFIAVAQHGKGEFVILTQSLWWNWIGRPEARETDNAKLLLRLLAGDRKQRSG